MTGPARSARGRDLRGLLDGTGRVLLAIGGFALLVLGLRGRVWALAILLAVGVALALLNNPFPQRLGPDFQRPEDISFTTAQLAVALMPATMALGAALRLIARVLRG